jgi:hypothetical protein
VVPFPGIKHASLPRQSLNYGAKKFCGILQGRAENGLNASRNDFYIGIIEARLTKPDGNLTKLFFCGENKLERFASISARSS